MDKDIAPELIENVNRDFETNIAKDKRAAALNKKLKAGTAKYEDAYDYAESVGKARVKAFDAQVTSEILPDGKMYYNIASRLLEDSLTTDHNMITDYAAVVQKSYNEKSGIGLNAIKADVDKDRIKGFIEGVCNADNYDDVKWKLGEPIITHARSVVDDTIKKNAQFQHKAGIKATVVRDAKADCCKWCTDLAGDYTYPKVPGEVFARHDNCRCTLDYNGRRLTAYESGGKAHSFRDQGEQERIETRISLDNSYSPSHNIRYKTGGMEPDEYARACELWKQVEEIKIPNREYIVEEFDRWLSDEEKKQAIVRHQVDNYWYTAINKGHNQYKFYSMVNAEPSWLDEVMTEVIGADWRKYE